MRQRLIEAGLWEQSDGASPEKDILCAWRVVSRLGYPGRFGGLSQDGQCEYLIVNPQTGGLLASGKGLSVTEAMCAAALAARSGGQPICNGPLVPKGVQS